MNKFLKQILILLLISIGSLNADSMFLLTKIKNVYLVVENYNTNISNTIKKDIKESLKSTTDELNIDSSGYSHRTLVVMIYNSSVNNTLILNVDLLLGEEVKRLDDNEEVYALTYEKRSTIVVGDKIGEDLEDEVLDNVDLLLSDFIEQYEEDNE
ncbi:MAG: hypothetical protein HOJ96_01695 [Campylobacteraceae bacterium]|jgi:hypothetical protein|nr:hypothetical protein [Campylobacteraceae bacterium]MBT4030172.1 hypothetical protein [Campylobacteraceae bacterium]MBT4573188.1 hypothetical protein [Campylobacteraceae bacterium]MBT4707422.1 hypothetical protein [Campylobacteraceae bacterium]MBT5323415.1 hypothetical protein [Campylobacteraceae bacterium]